MTTHMENEDVNSINSLNIEKNGAKKFSGNFKARGEEVLGNGYLERLKEAERLRKKDLTGAVAIVDLTPVKNNSSGNTMQAQQSAYPIWCNPRRRVECLDLI